MMDGIAVEESCQCCLTNNNENQISHDNNKHDEGHWHTITKDSFGVPECEKKSLGRRRDLIKSMICEQVLRKIKDDEAIVYDGTNPSEYNDKFCDPKFIPYLDKLVVDGDILAKYPLYSSNNQTIYKDQIDRGSLKARAEISDLNEPFRKKCTFTTPPDQAIREPTGGF
ncbi:uncharacterized protein [Venturia canescens]|uniref:uncharacterized protein n=1 Tax=Venturia canescens TaxID=32260 RepID=UPI001C9C4C06|nr:uncharacterized protein LOC122417222 [Venturia canescens]